MSARPFTTLLVANRGEIARRIFRTARGMGLRCVAVYVDADVDAPFVTEADLAVRLGTGYLDVDAVIAAAERAGAEAIHPGYGFLSENAGFAEAVIARGLVWVGPPPAVVASMGDKLAAKRAAAAAGVPTLVSVETPAAAAEVGYPLLVKAAAGGGGKGMRIVEAADQLDEAVAAARREAASAFGDDRVFLERYVARSRHIEIQVLGDTHGALVHLGERECSIQRRHQKIIEESPSPVGTAELRARMGDAALLLARTLGYESVGTVEFLVDDATREFFFLEVNTRLQVEHPVTEAVTGIDLVREQLRVAMGEPLGYDQAAVTFTGHAIEARLSAEDPASGFLPATGRLSAFEPPTDPVVRWDSGVGRDSVVSVHFDPMLAKVVAHGPTRAEAAGRLAGALERLHVGGVATNRDFLVATLRHPAFLAGDTTTDFIERHRPTLRLEPSEGERWWVTVAAAMWLQARARAEAPVLGGVPSGWRNARLPDQDREFVVEGESTRLSYLRRRDGSFRVAGPHGTATVVVHGWAPDRIDVAVDGLRSAARVTPTDDRLFVQIARGTIAVEVVPRFVAPGAAAVAGGFLAPMPGTVTDVRCAVGDVVHAGQTLLVLEAMKMEHRMNAPAAGRVAEVRVVVGQPVDNGAVLLVFEPDERGE